MTNLKNRSLAHAVLDRQLPKRQFRTANLCHLLVGEFPQLGHRTPPTRSNPFFNMLWCLAPTARADSGGLCCGPRNLALTNDGKTLAVLFTLFSSQESGPCFRSTFGCLFSSGLGQRPPMPFFRRRIISNSSFSSIGQIGQVATCRPIVSNPPAFRFIPVAIARLNNFHVWAKSGGSQLHYPMSLVRYDILGAADMCGQSLAWCERPSDISHGIVPRVKKDVDVPSPCGLHAFQLYHKVCADTRKNRKAVGGYGNQAEGRGKENAGRERVWFSPYCLPPRQKCLF